VTAIGLQLDVSEGRPMSSDFATIQETLAEVGIGVWPLDLRGVPDEFRELIHRPSLSDKERDRLLAHFMLHRERPVSSQLADASAVTNDGAV